jgi:hypothetical protein
MDYESYSDDIFFTKLLRMLNTNIKTKTNSLKDQLMAQRFHMPPGSTGLEVFNAVRKIERYREEVTDMSFKDMKAVIKHIQSELWKAHSDDNGMKAFLRALDSNLNQFSPTYNQPTFVNQVAQVWVNFLPIYQMMVAETTADEAKRYGKSSGSTEACNKSKKKSMGPPQDKKGPQQDKKKRSADDKSKPTPCKCCGRTHKVVSNIKDCSLYEHPDSNKSNHDFHLSDKGRLWIQRFEQKLCACPTVDPYKDLLGNTVSPPEKYLAARAAYKANQDGGAASNPKKKQKQGNSNANVDSFSLTSCACREVN